MHHAASACVSVVECGRCGWRLSGVDISPGTRLSACSKAQSGILRPWHVPLTWVRALCSHVEVSAGAVRLGSSAGEVTAVIVEGSCTIDALHSGSAHPKAVWWQNAAASSEGAAHDAAADVLRSDQ